MRWLLWCVVGCLWPCLAGAQQATWVIPGSATDAVGRLLGGLEPHLKYRSASVESSVIRVEACAPTGACVRFELGHLTQCLTPVGPFCVTYPGAAPAEDARSVIERVLAGAAHDDFWAMRAVDARRRVQGAPSPQPPAYRSPIQDPRPRPHGVPSPWTVALSVGVLLGAAAVGLADRWRGRPLLRRLAVPTLAVIAMGGLWLSQRPILWSVLLPLVFFALVFGWRCLDRAVAINVLVAGVLLLGTLEFVMLLFDYSLAPKRTRANRFNDDPVLEGRLAGVPDAAATCEVLDAREVMPTPGRRSVLHVVPSREPASVPFLRARRQQLLALPGDAYVRAVLARDFLKRHRPKVLVLHLKALDDLRQWGAPLPCCGDRAPFRLENGSTRFVCSEGTGESTPSRFSLLAARSVVPLWLEDLARLSVVAGALDRAALSLRRQARDEVPTPREAILALTTLHVRLAEEARAVGSELIVVLEPDLAAFSSPVPHLTVEGRYHSALAQALISNDVRVIDLWAALDAADDDRPWHLVDHGELTPRGHEVMSVVLQHPPSMATPAGDGDLRR